MASDDSHVSPRPDVARRNLWWWIGQLALTAIALFFCGFGICLLAAAYRLGDPFSFIMTFFGASLMILISAVMVLGFVLRMRLASRAAASRKSD